MKKKTINNYKKDLLFYQVASLILLGIVILGSVFVFPRLQEDNNNKESVVDSQLLISTVDNSATLVLDLDVPDECNLARVWHKYLTAKDGGTSYPFTIQCPN